MHALRWFVWMALAACASERGANAATATPAFDRVAARIESARGYSMRVDAHESLGDRSEDMSYRYDRPAAQNGRAARPELSILEGRGTGAKLAYVGDDRVEVRAPEKPISLRLSANAAIATTLRGSSILAAGLDAFVECASAHRASLTERAGPAIDGIPTIAIVLERKKFACPRDTKTDAELTLDVLFVSQSGDVPVLRKRYAGNEIVVRWRIRDFV